jgi:NAD(P)-dependent dehydrogenase (short-subunit alcohol dehydrogenase family)
MSPRIWFITGVSSGFGRSLALAVAASGDIAVGTLRQAAQLVPFDALVPGRTVAVQLDINDHAQVDVVVSGIIGRFGRIDVLVNNAGYGLLGAIEEVDDTEARAQMETNFFGALAVTRAVLPHLRRQRAGHILQVSSIAGFSATPGLGIYNASKFALEGFSEALARETAPLGIRVTLIEPGPFRTKWAGDSIRRAAAVIPDYAATPAGATLARIQHYGAQGTQPGDPALAARAMISVVNSPHPPLRLPLGALALAGVRAKLEAVRQELDEWEAVGLATDAPPNG